LILHEKGPNHPLLSLLGRSAKKHMESTLPTILPISDNLRAVVRNADDNPQAVIIHIQARDAEEPIGFRIRTNARIVSHFWELPQLRGGNWLTFAEDVLPDGYRILIDRTFLDHPLIIGLEFEHVLDPASSVLGIETWDGTDGAPSVIYVEQNEDAEQVSGGKGGQRR
jgi:hypothetical protein